MRADIHDGSEHTLQSEAGYIDARPHQPELRKPLASHGRTIHQGQNENPPFLSLCQLPPAADVQPHEAMCERRHCTAAMQPMDYSITSSAVGARGGMRRVRASTSPRRFSESWLNFSRRPLWRLSVPPWVAPGMRVSLRGRRYRNRSCEGPAMSGGMRGSSGPTSWAGYIEDRSAHEFLTCGEDMRRGSIDELRVCT